MYALSELSIILIQYLRGKIEVTAIFDNSFFELSIWSYRYVGSPSHQHPVLNYIVHSILSVNIKKNVHLMRQNNMIERVIDKIIFISDVWDT